MEEIIGHPSTVEWPNYTPDDDEFRNAMDRYKVENNRPFPTWREVLAVVRSLGYRKVAEKVDLPRFVSGKGKLTGMKGRHDAGRELDNVPRASSPSDRSIGKPSQRNYSGRSELQDDNK